MIKPGAHVSAAVSLDLSIERAAEIGAEATQIFISPPQQWLKVPHGEEEVKLYLEAAKKHNITTNFIHGTYLVNLATDNEEHLKKSIDWLVYALDMSAKLGIKGVIFHTGSHKGRGFQTVLDQLIASIKEILDKSSKESTLIIENCAGSGGVIGNFSEIGQMLKGVRSDRLGVCLDTQHTFAAGYDLTKETEVERMVKELDNEIGFDKLMAVHCNDSKVECGSSRDR